jgi:hypothetical protein
MDDEPERSTEKHVSPDGALRFLIVREQGDVSLGFEGTPWHTHADILASLSDLSQEDAVSQFVASLLENKSAIAVATVNGQVRDVWICDNPTEVDMSYKPEDEVITFRLWDGSAL